MDNSLNSGLKDTSSEIPSLNSETPPCQVKLAVTHHVLSSTDKIEQDKPLVFVIDPPKHDREEDGKPKKKKTKKDKVAGSMTHKNFGSILDIGKFKRAQRLMVGWRMRCAYRTNVHIVPMCFNEPFGVLFGLHSLGPARLDANNASGVKTLVPLRPIACVTGVLDLGSTVIKMF